MIDTLQDQELSTSEAAAHFGLNIDTFVSHALHYGLRPSRHLKTNRMWSLDYLKRWDAIRGRKSGRPKKSLTVESAAEYITKDNPLIYEQIKALLEEGVASGKLDFKAYSSKDAIRRCRDYLLHEAGDWTPLSSMESIK